MTKPRQQQLVERGAVVALLELAIIRHEAQAKACVAGGPGYRQSRTLAEERSLAVAQVLDEVANMPALTESNDSRPACIHGHDSGCMFCDPRLRTEPCGDTSCRQCAPEHGFAPSTIGSDHEASVLLRGPDGRGGHGGSAGPAGRGDLRSSGDRDQPGSDVAGQPEDRDLRAAEVADPPSALHPAPGTGSDGRLVERLRRSGGADGVRRGVHRDEVAREERFARCGHSWGAWTCTRKAGHEGVHQTDADDEWWDQRPEDTEGRFAPVTKSAPLDAYQDERRLACDLGLCEQHGSRTPREHLVVPNGNTDTENRAKDAECDRSVTPTADRRLVAEKPAHMSTGIPALKREEQERVYNETQEMLRNRDVKGLARALADDYREFSGSADLSSDPRKAGITKEASEDGLQPCGSCGRRPFNDKGSIVHAIDCPVRLGLNDNERPEGSRAACNFHRLQGYETCQCPEGDHA